MGLGIRRRPGQGFFLTIEDGANEKQILEALRRGTVRVCVESIDANIISLKVYAPKEIRILRNELQWGSSR